MMINYVKFNEINPNDFIPLLNNPKNRKHLMQHNIFTLDSTKAWISSTLRVRR